MSKGYKFIIGGIILTMIDFSLGAINILPNYLGYLIIFVGLESLFEYSQFERFKQLKQFCLFLIGLSFITEIGGFVGLFNNYFLFFIISMTNTILKFIFLFNLADYSIEYLSSVTDNHTNVKEYVGKLKIFTIFGLVGITSIGFSLIFNLSLLSFIVIFILLANDIYLITIINSLKNDFVLIEK